MADLLNVLEHKKNTKVSVDGTIYSIGPDGVAKGVSEEHAAKMLQNSRVWKSYDPKRASAQRAQAVVENRGKMKLLDNSGDVVPVDDKPGEPMDPVLEAYQRPAPDAKPAEGPPPIPASVEPKAEEPEEEGAAEAEEPKAEATEEEEEWPDPKESMTVAYLHQMAKAYEVDVGDKPSKKTLVKRISKAMYE